ncbi:Bug family tripartite tricarboxylate transporter substrate binding protein [Neorhizobium galegae]|uniref:Extra-cytoplasmic Solute Receptor n=1 Tax=Neorhizobium galegae bv. orientalis str. HAMBI 540 TaxID=1028800 RepID=A0A068T2L6_NEOGA|nr:tripartite tricarboxylate transporter substrate binding protein [Neorhizobium galegae]MCQ1851957.1 tripartite tricarboxylate transporter substrate binding protein [Neorhizobium galegae]CDN52261.1 Extra-cytoplasmic Solute Receptor [Neorhizobium galegae bv. orientalis str. HAMBI 540]CDZ43445.1 Extra-cytoplasmic solute receptor [Neorhizobium galegae bv. orientalis]
MNRREFIVLGGSAVALASGRIAIAANWPSKSVVVISAYPPGGTSDIIARLVADLLTTKFGQQFVIENLAGAAGALAGGKLARSAPDGYTILISGSAPIAANKVVQTNLAYDPQVDFTPITVVAESPALLTASAKAPAKSLQELIAYAKANPGKINIGNPGAGTKGHICAAIISLQTGIEINHIPYKGSPPLLADLLGGHIDFALDAPSNYLPHIKDGKIHGVAVTSAQRIGELPNVKTVAEQGLKDYNQTLWFGAVGPKGMSPEIVSAIHKAIKEWSDTPAAKAKLASLGLTAVVNTPDEMRGSIEREIESLKPLVKAGLVQPS